MSAVNELINVSYKDLTNYPAEQGGDMLACPFEHFWGPVGRLIPMSQQAFFETYPEELPPYQTSVRGSRFFAYASIKRAFENGIRQVEAYRVQGNWNYVLNKIVAMQGAIPASNAMFETSFVSKTTGSLADCVCAIYSKYPGLPPASELNGDEAIVLYIKRGSGITFTIQVVGASRKDNSTDTVITVGTGTTAKWEVNFSNILESWDVSLDPAAEQDGQSIFIENVLQKSSFISARLGDVVAEFAEPFEGDDDDDVVISRAAYFPVDAPISGSVADSIFSKISEPSDADFSKGLQAYNDTMLSDATMIISPLGNVNLDSEVKNIAGLRQDLNAYIGYPVASTFAYADILSRLQTVKGTGTQPKFSFFYAGRESYKIFGLPVTLNCIGGVCGATAAVAKAEKTNQLASAFTYGAYNGTLTETLTFEEVCQLMELGGNSVFTSVRGPIIWGTRSLHPRQTSYYGKANVMRVLAEILRQVFPVCLDAIHTDAAANPLTRSTFQTTFSGIISDEIAAENLIGDSSANCGADVNTDKNTKGGTIFNLDLILHFIGLVEKVRIRVMATDSSVTTSIE